MKKTIAIIVAAMSVALLIGASYIGFAGKPSFISNADANPDISLATDAVASFTTTNIGESNKKPLVGSNGGFLLVDSISDAEYAEIMDILYPNGLFEWEGVIDGQDPDWQPQDNPSIDNFDAARASFIAEHTKAFSVDGANITEVKIVPFNVNLKSKMNGTYECLFYKATVGDDSFVFPSEWGNQPCGFATSAGTDVYLAYTDLGIWRINPATLKADRISSDTYSGKSQSEIESGIKALHEDGYLLWIDNVIISPDGINVVYRTNRDCSGLVDTSIWAVNIQTGEERRVVEPAINNDIVGFVSNSHIVVGSLDETRIVDISTGKDAQLSFPKIPNFSVNGVSDGIIVYSSYPDGSSETTAYVSRLDTATGEISPIAEVKGYLEAEPMFSPSGGIVAIGYGTEPMIGTVDVMLVNLADGTQKTLTDSMQDDRQINGYIRRFHWACDGALVVDVQSNGGFSAFLVAPSKQ